MHWNGISPYVGAALLFLVAQVAPSLKTFTDHLVLARIKKRDAKLETATGRADAAAEKCLEQLGILQDVVPALVRYQRRTPEGMEATIEELRHRRDDALAAFEANIALLLPISRPEMTLVLEIMREADDLPYEGNSSVGGWHPDSTYTIVAGTVRYGRHLLSAQLSRTDAPPRPEPIEEYRLALADRESDLEAEYANEIHEDELKIERFRERHGLPRRRSTT